MVIPPERFLHKSLKRIYSCGVKEKLVRTDGQIQKEWPSKVFPPSTASYSFALEAGKAERSLSCRLRKLRSPASRSLRTGKLGSKFLKASCGSGRRTHRSPLLEAFAAINRAALRRLEGDGCLLPALRTGRFRFGSLEIVALARGLSAFCFAVLAPLRLILEAFIGEKHLFAGGEDELRIAFRAL
jgi:hypothetical protein